MYVNNNQTFLIDESRPSSDIVDYRSEDSSCLKQAETTNSGLRRVIDIENLAYTVLEERQLTREEMIEVRENLRREEERVQAFFKKHGCTSLFDNDSSF